VLIDGFAPQFGDVFDIMDLGSLGGGFGSIDTAAAPLTVPLAWDTSQLYLGGTLRVDVVHFADDDLAPWCAPDSQVNAADVDCNTAGTGAAHVRTAAVDARRHGHGRRYRPRRSPHDPAGRTAVIFIGLHTRKR